MFSILYFNKLALIALMVSMSCDILFSQHYQSGWLINPWKVSNMAETTTKPSDLVYENGKWVKNTQPTYIPRATQATREFLEYFSSCPATSEYQPVCATNREQYYNIGKFQCARRCGLDIQIVVNGTCPRRFPSR